MALAPTVFNPVITGINAVPSFFSAPFVSGYEIAIASATTFTVSPGGARSYTSDYVIMFPTIQPNSPSLITVDISTVGANGAYPVAIADAITTDTMLPVYILGDMSGKNVPVVVIATNDNFILPGYTDYRRIGWAFINFTAMELYPMVQSGHAGQREYSFRHPADSLGAGSAVTATAVQLLGVPQSATEVTLLADYTPAAAADFVSLSLSAVATAIVEIQASDAATVKTQVSISPVVVADVSTIYYFNSAAAGALTLAVTGFVDDMGINAG